MQISAFPGVEKKSKKLKKLFSEYEFNDLVAACFCISINRNNRSTLENCLTMNQALLEYNPVSVERKRIDNFESFKEFFNIIQRKLPITHMDDYTVPDFGEVKIVFNGKAYKTFIGTGHTQVYSCLSYLPSVASVTKKEHDFKIILQYQDLVITYFESDNVLIDNDGTVRFDLPSEELFCRAKSFFKEQIQKIDFNSLLEAFPQVDKRIEKKHFVNYEGKIYPLFNTTLVLDMMCSGIINEQVEKDAVLCGLYDYINYAEQFSGNEKGVFVFPTIFKDNSGPIKGTKADFTITCNNGIVICLDNETWEEEKNNFRKLDSQLQNIDLDILETRRRPGRNGQLALRLEASKVNVKYVVYTPILNIDVTRRIRIVEESNTLFCSSLDLIVMLQFADNTEEIWDYLEYATKPNKSKIHSMGGKSGEFLSWKENGHYFEKGAVSFGFIDIGYNSEIESIWDYFNNQLKYYPWELVSNYLFENPFIWNIKKEDGIFWEYVSKVSGYGGYIASVGKITIFLSNNIEFYKGEKIENTHHILNEVIPLTEDIIKRMTSSCKELLLNIKEIPHTLLQIMLMPESYYQKVTNDQYDRNRKFVYSDASGLDNSFSIRYMVKEDALYEEISKANNRIVECEYIKELFMPLKRYNIGLWNSLVKKMEEISQEEKQVGVFQTRLSYRWNGLSKKYIVTEEAYYSVRKRIAKRFAENQIEPGEYFGKVANTIIRKTQKSLIEDFESFLAKYGQFDLQVKLEEIYSQVLHNISMHRKRYTAIKEIQENIKEEVQKKIIREREEFKHQKRVLEYLMESNLYCKRGSNQRIFARDLEVLLAYANWLVVLSDNADICHFTEDEVHVNVSFENVVDIISNENGDSYTSNIAQRIYNDFGYGIVGDEEDKAYYLKTTDAFLKDTGLNFAVMLDFLDFLCLELVCEQEKEIAPNVYIMPLDEMINQYLELEGVKCTKEEIKRVVDYLIIDPDKLKTCKGMSDYYLPIGKRNERENRIEMKCFWNIDENVMFSLVMCNHVKDSWFRGVTEFYLPFTIGLTHTVKAIEEWKRRYEKKIVFDIEEHFRKYGYKKVFHNFDPRKMDRKDKNLLTIGDYDVLAIDELNKKIWMIECKMLAKVGSFYEMYMQQKSFFYGHKDDEHFQTRIDHMKKNYHKILKHLGCDYNEKYEIVPYMVMNKILESRYKKLSFQIISVSELFTLISAK